jgi:two-component system, OmpR family, osmolarity sensor histidine kinase EnvZ
MTAWLPRSLFGRNVLLLVAVLVISQVITVAAFWALVQRPRMEAFAHYARVQADAVSLALTELPQHKRAAYIAQLNTTDEMQILLNQQPPASPSSGNRLVLRFIDLVRNVDGANYVSRWQSDAPRRLWLGRQIGGDMLWIGLSAEGFLSGIVELLMVSLATVCLLALGGAWWIQRRINRPLNALADAAAQVAQGTLTAPVPLGMPTELAVVHSSFKHMVDALAQAEQNRTLMLAGISHDLRTPLAKIRLGLELLGPQKDLELMQRIERSVDAADAIVGQFVDFARSAGPVAHERVDLNALAREAATLAGGAVSLSLHPQPLWVRADRNALLRAVLNLLSNAEKYAARQQATQVLTTVQGGQPALGVLDRGPGIDPAQWAALLLPFVRGSSARTGQSGAGLGLAIVKRITDANGAELAMRQRAGGGLEIWMVFAKNDA